MELLLSNYSPLKTGCNSYPKTFENLLKNSSEISVATGFFSTYSIVDLKRIVTENDNLKLEVCIGMHYFSGVSPIQLQALKDFNHVLLERGQGRVYMVTTFPYHGKLVSFSDRGAYKGTLLGSSNLSNIIDGSRQYEVDLLISDEKLQDQLGKFIIELIKKSSEPLDELDIQATVPENDLMKDQLGVEQLDASTIEWIKGLKSIEEFRIPLKGDESKKSGLNTYLGEGRKNVQGTKLPRSWYEVELIVPKIVTSRKGYPRASKADDSGTIEVVTDDHWKFKCKVSGDFSKNLRSADDLKILGKWIKGRLVNAGVLKPGDMVTNETLASYGRQDITLKKLEENIWFLDFKTH